MVLFQLRSERHLRLFGVHCNNMATDDVFFPTMLSFAFKATWMYVSLGVAIYLFLHPECSSLSLPLLLSISIIGFMVIQLAGIINDIITIVISCFGSLSNFEPRKPVEIFVYTGFILYLTQICWDVYSTYTIFSPQVVDSQLTNCTSYETALIIYQGVILSHWGILVLFFFLYLVWMDPLACYNIHSKIQEFDDNVAALEKSRDGDPTRHNRGVHSNAISCIFWLKQCKCWKKRGVSTARQQALGDMVNAFKVLFEDMDYTFFDIKSGFKLLSLYHEKLRKKKKDPADLIIKKTIDILRTNEDYCVPSDPKPLEDNDPELKQHVVDLKYYLDYAMASYGWPIYVYLNPCKGLISLCVSSRCNCCCARCQLQQFDGDTGFPNPAAIKAMTGVQDEDIVTASFVNAVHIVPFYVVKVEREGRKQVIIAIRGTLSIKDALTDVSASMCKIDENLLGVNPTYIHRGFYQAALGIYKHLTEHDTFKDLVINQNYEIVVTGHSLGAAVSSVLAVLLKHKHPEWTENLKAFNFATPAVFNYPLAKKTDDFIISVVSGYDVVPRMTFRGLGHLIFSIADLIENSKHTKQSIICCSGRCGWELDVDTDVIEARQAATLQDLKLPNTDSYDDNDDDVDGDNHIDTSALARTAADGSKKRPMIGKKLLRHLSLLFAKEKFGILATSGRERDRPMLFTPGRIIHLEVEEIDKMKSCCSCGLKEAGKVKASWKAREDLSGIQVHDSMLLDHGPTRTIDFINTLHYQLVEAENGEEN